MKRFFDLVFSVLLFTATLPLLLVLLLLTWFQLRCNVFHIQERVGKNGKLFSMYKITTMKPTPENILIREQRPICRNDNRLTAFSRFLRRYSLDELPQFINVMKGDMSLVGPRPQLVSIVQKWSETLPNYLKRHEVRPGITGWAQINGFRKDNFKPETRLGYDLYYIEHWSLRFDLAIIFRTPFSVLNARDAW